MPTRIEWSDETWNPTVGCSKVSPGCDNCYAINVAHRAMQPAHEGLTILEEGQRPDWTGEVRELPDRLDSPMRWRKPRRIFVDSMSDLFHANVSRSFLADVFARMALSRRHTFQILTKRPQRLSILSDPDFIREIAEASTEIIGRTGSYGRYQINTDGWTPTDDGVGSNLWWPVWPLPNVWIGTSIESDSYVWRADHVRTAAAAVRFLSLEPLIGPLPSLDLTDIDWVIVGGESGPGARAMHPQWVRDLRDRCTAASVPFFFKQWGSWAAVQYPDHGRKGDRLIFASTASWEMERERAIYVREVGKKKAGRELDGRTWDEMPTTGQEVPA